MDIKITYIIVIGLMTLDESKSSTSAREDIKCENKKNCAGCDKLLDDGGNNNATGLYRCEEGFVLTEYIIRNCTQGKCENECFSVSNQTTNRLDIAHLHIDVNETYIRPKCSTGVITMIKEFMGCTNDSFIGVIPQCLATDVIETQTTGQPNLKLIIAVTVAGSVRICFTAIIIGCCSRRRRNTWREPYNARTFIAKQLTSNTTDINSHISTMPTNNVGSTVDTGEMQNSLPSQHNTPAYLICDKQEEVDDVYNTAESDNAFNDYVSPVYGHNDILRDNDSPLPSENETKCFNNAAETIEYYDTIGGINNSKIVATGNGGHFMDMLDITDGEYDHLHVREPPQTNDTYSHLKEIHETTHYDSEYAHVTSCVQEPVTNTNTDEQIEDSTYDLTATQYCSESEHNSNLQYETEAETDNTIAEQNETDPYSQLSF